jgi:hypothetical protein
MFLQQCALWSTRIAKIEAATGQMGLFELREPWGCVTLDSSVTLEKAVSSITIANIASLLDACEW